jgi:tRNA modification GTPase
MLRSRIIELLGRLEAGLDFSEEDIVFISTEDALKEVDAVRQQLVGLLEGSIRCERIIDMDSVGLAGVPNAGKSRLLNRLLGHSRSIVSDTEATTRDVLTGLLKLENINCVLFDCAGLL